MSIHAASFRESTLVHHCVCQLIDIMARRTKMRVWCRLLRYCGIHPHGERFGMRLLSTRENGGEMPSPGGTLLLPPVFLCSWPTHTAFLYFFKIIIFKKPQTRNPRRVWLGSCGCNCWCLKGCRKILMERAGPSQVQPHKSGKSLWLSVLSLLPTSLKGDGRTLERSVIHRVCSDVSLS